MCYLLIEAGYFIGIAKLQWVASTKVRFFGFLCDSLCQAFLLPDDKMLKLSSLRADVGFLQHWPQNASEICGEGNFIQSGSL